MRQGSCGFVCNCQLTDTVLGGSIFARCFFMNECVIGLRTVRRAHSMMCTLNRQTDRHKQRNP